jgi:hypothetical protein
MRDGLPGLCRGCRFVIVADDWPPFLSSSSLLPPVSTSCGTRSLPSDRVNKKYQNTAAGSRIMTTMDDGTWDASTHHTLSIVKSQSTCRSIGSYDVRRIVQHASYVNHSHNQR